MFSLLKKPSAWIPIAIPLIGFAYMIMYIYFFSIVRNEDEGTGAHLFQIWLVLEVFIVPFFAIKWLPQAPKQALVILAIQIVTALMVIAPVFYFKL